MALAEQNTDTISDITLQRVHVDYRNDYAAGNVVLDRSGQRCLVFQVPEAFRHMFETGANGLILVNLDNWREYSYLPGLQSEVETIEYFTMSAEAQGKLEA